MTTDQNRSPLAVQVTNVRDPKDGWLREPWGFLLHTTGGGITDAAVYDQKTRAKLPTRLNPLDVAIKAYVAAQNGSNGYLWGGPGYVIEHDGTIHQLAPDNLNMQHAGGQNRPRYFDGSWESVYPVTTKRWHEVWSPIKHPYALFPSTSPNHDYVGCEMIPCGDGFGTPMAPGLRFTQAQHDAAAALARDCAARHAWPVDWQNGPRLVGHEDVDPLNRSYHQYGREPEGGWDPGFLRPNPYFDFTYVRASI